MFPQLRLCRPRRRPWSSVVALSASQPRFGWLEQGLIRSCSKCAASFPASPPQNRSSLSGPNSASPLWLNCRWRASTCSTTLLTSLASQVTTSPYAIKAICLSPMTRPRCLRYRKPWPRTIALGCLIRNTWMQPKCMPSSLTSPSGRSAPRSGRTTAGSPPMRRLRASPRAATLGSCSIPLPPGSSETAPASVRSIRRWAVLPPGWSSMRPGPSPASSAGWQASSCPCNRCAGRRCS